jgi:hypothetical protein
MSTAVAATSPRKFTLSLPRLDATGLITGVIYIIFLGYSFHSFTDPDYWWHLRTGQLIVQTHSIPYYDVFSFTMLGRRLIVDQWLAEVLIYLGVTNLGYAFTFGIFAALSLASFGLMHRLLLRLGVPRLSAVVLITLAMAMSVLYWTARPQVLSWFFLAICINALMFRKEKLPWLLVPVMVLWANLHPGFIFGLMVIAIWFAARMWDHLADGAAFRWRQAGLFVAACWGATVLNPNGPLLLLHRISYLPFFGGSMDLQTITEWASPNFHDPIHYPLVLGIVLLVALGLPGRVRDRFAVLLAVAFMMLALDSSRYQPSFAIAFLPAVGLASRELPMIRFRAPTELQSLAHWFVVGLTVVVVFAITPVLPHAQLQREPRTDGVVYYPADALGWVQQHEPNANVYTDYIWGGFFLNTIYPSGHVFIDGRSDSYGDRVFEDYRSIMAANYQWQAMLENSGANVVVIKPSTRLASALREASGWTLALETPKAIVFVRAGTD